MHLPSGDDQLAPEQIRELFGKSRRYADPYSGPREGEVDELPQSARTPIVSVSCHTFAEVMRAEKSGADLILFGPVFGKLIAGELVVPETGLAALREACELAGETPVLALGGVTAANQASCRAATRSSTAFNSGCRIGLLR